MTEAREQMTEDRVPSFETCRSQADALFIIRYFAVVRSRL